MGTILILLIQIAFTLFSLACGISLITSNWKEFKQRQPVQPVRQMTIRLEYEPTPMEQSGMQMLVPA